MLSRIITAVLVILCLVIVAQSLAKVLTGRATKQEVMAENRRFFMRVVAVFIFFTLFNLILRFTSG
jgi:hypothetical protein